MVAVGEGEDGMAKMVAARFELARDCSHRESRNLKSDALDQLGHATFREPCSSDHYIAFELCKLLYIMKLSLGKSINGSSLGLYIESCVIGSVHKTLTQAGNQILL